MTAASTGPRLFAFMLLAAILFAHVGISVAADSSGAAASDGVVMKNGKPMMLRDGKPTEPMDHETALDNGARVMPDGKVMTTDGKQIQMREGTVIMKSGRIMHGSHAIPMTPPAKPAAGTD